jgi:hypothetical protein
VYTQVRTATYPCVSPADWSAVTLRLTYELRITRARLRAVPRQREAYSRAYHVALHLLAGWRRTSRVGGARARRGARRERDA